MLVENVDGMARPRQLFAAHSPRRPTTDNDIVSHWSPEFRCFHLRHRKDGRLQGGMGLQDKGKSTRQNPASSIAPNNAATGAAPDCRRTNWIPSPASSACSTKNG